VAGGGPAGLMAAFDLSRRGYRVTLFEAQERLGGALRLIPAYRLPAETLNSTIDNLVRIAGIEVRCRSRIGCGELTLETLKEQGFQAVFIAKGSPSPRLLSFAGEKLAGQNLSGVMFGHDFLYEVNHGNLVGNYFKGRRILVIGGGNVAFDVARTARRLGGDTSLICLECDDKDSPDGIPADDDEIKGAWEEGVRLVYSRGVRRILGRDGIFQGIETVRCRQVYDQSGFNPSFDPNDIRLLAAEVLIIAVGQGPDRDLLCQEGLLDSSGRLAADPLTLQSLNLPRVFVGGDMRRIGFMVEAMQDGLVAAESIDRFLCGGDLHEGRQREFQAQEIPLRRHYLQEPEICWISPEKRLHFEVFEEGFDLAEAIDEARRCLACGPCASCKACVSIGLQDTLPTVEVDEKRCCGCGVCVTACYYGSAQPRISGEKIVSTSDRFKCKGCGQCVVACPSAARRMVADPTAAEVRQMLNQLAEKEVRS
jgi:NADPH-dependent glutamate synthase beta subunit-like oxidoreductase